MNATEQPEDKKKTSKRNRVREQFEREYWDAHLSKVHLPDDIISKILDWTKKAKDILFFASNPGVGKTYLAAAIANEWDEKNYPFRAFNERSLLSHLRGVIREGNSDYEHELRRLCDCPFFILDDLGTAKETDFQKEVIFDFVDLRWSSRKPTIITSNVSISYLGEYFGDRFVSRMNDGRNVVIEYCGEDRRQNR